jgi:hypothetical protein
MPVMTVLRKSISVAWSYLRSVPIEILTALNGVLMLFFWLFSYKVFDHTEKYKYPPAFMALGLVLVLCIPYYIVKHDEEKWHGLAYIFGYVMLFAVANDDISLFMDWLGK